MEKRLIDLETKFSYQDVQIEELKQTVHDQYVRIEKFEKQLQQLILQIRDGQIIRPNEKPPHY